ncbi:MAG: 16S rRNA (guanine(966)-N(2))-methyltransferase RsmD [Gammaproteobacteria bacterium]|nr:MAG: 16S rRNA (guanine(966)-N(2))-methyltransferase RsmD [Gammaproteobacteria bacterium]
MARKGEGRLRIIAGRFRGRRLAFPPLPGLRPTPDRVRETLFSWLAPHLPGARCLDLFAGSGALGFEALSRGAKEVIFVERHPKAAARLRENIALLGVEDRARVYAMDALDFLRRLPPEPFDIAFLDPPYGERGLLERAARLLEERGWLAPGALIYVEASSHAPSPALPEAWEAFRHRRAGEVDFSLWRRP